ncbi:6-bladed beta-propeller [Candidatus Nitrosocosmicus agrestis]|uniref:6-bladed beta-propeller n=1 Tax=Candidatus Nitrosocosmicus agrestis TaxID=2563600 RepID=UPI00122E76DE|nr:6-bladed beta-propeller [Candidatus Nitrosocosmicus sp. SS]KAA2279358.1 6-bladed beta-propeller [Candidatus Nitrosocosmicus sp. SS]KAF0867851.1 6-bladed beta-propeller [Candidatus Nitrosocosmicus sp. SS]
MSKISSNLILFIVIFSGLGGMVIIHTFNNYYFPSLTITLSPFQIANAQSSDLQLSNSPNFADLYSDMPSDFGQTYSDLGSIGDSVTTSIKNKFTDASGSKLKETIIDDQFQKSGSPDNQINNSIKNKVYVVDYSNVHVQKFDNSGDFISKWGTKGKSDGQFGVPHGIDVDKQGNVYVVDMANFNVQKFDSEGNFLLKWGSMGTGDGQFNSPESVSVDSENNVYVTDTDNNNVQKFDSEGNFLLKWGSMGTGDGQLKRPSGLDIDDNNNVYVTDVGNNRIQKFSSDGEFLNS